MHTVVAAFATPADAQNAVEQLRGKLPGVEIKVFAPGTSLRELETVRNTEDMPPVGMIFGIVIGGALGLGVGANLFLPGFDTVTATGLFAMLSAGLAAAALGGWIGHVIDDNTDEGVGEDELFVYEDALRKGRTVVFLQRMNAVQTREARTLLAELYPESVDAAHSQWWVGLRDDSELEYEPAAGRHP
jgi:hypothetical protein